MSTVHIYPFGQILIQLVVHLCILVLTVVAEQLLDFNAFVLILLSFSIVRLLWFLFILLFLHESRDGRGKSFLLICLIDDQIFIVYLDVLASYNAREHSPVYLSLCSSSIFV